MTASNFPNALARTLKHEGGWVHNLLDPGGETNFGVTQRVYDGFRAKAKLQQQSVKNITQEEVAAIYRFQYWNAVHGDELPTGVDFAVFDAGVMSGPKRAIKWLQSALNVPADGVLGLVTLGQLPAVPATSLVERVCFARLAFCKSLPIWGTFGKGWEKRIRKVQIEATAMVGKG